MSAISRLVRNYCGPGCTDNTKVQYNVDIYTTTTVVLVVQTILKYSIM